MKPVLETLKTSKRYFAMLMSASALTLLATACGSSGGGGGGGIVYPVATAGIGGYGVPTCANCPSSEAFIANSISDSTGSIAEMGLYFYGNAATVQQDQQASQQYGTSVPYYGPTAATGYLYLASGLPACNIPAGTYSLSTQQAGVLGADGAGLSVDSLVLIGNGVPMLIGVSGYRTPSAPAAIGRDGNSYPYRFVATQLLIQRTDTGAICNLNLQLQ